MRFSNSTGLFQANRVCEIPKAYGDLAHLGNRADLREYRRDYWEVDACGYRNPLNFPREQTDVIVSGTSFTAGTGVEMKDDLSSALQSKSSLRVYNIGGGYPQMRWLKPLIQNMGLKKGLVILEYNERFEFFSPISKEFLAPEAFCKPTRSSLSIKWKEFYGISKLALFSRDSLLRLQNGRWFPNPLADTVRELALVDGSPILFLPEEISLYQAIRKTDGAIGAFKDLKNELAALKFDLVVVLAPTKYSVYAPLLKVSPGSGQDYFSRLAREANKAGIVTINLLPMFRAKSQELFKEGKLIYWRDDTHWNESGIDLAAQTLAALPELRKRRVLRE